VLIRDRSVGLVRLTSRQRESLLGLLLLSPGLVGLLVFVVYPMLSGTWLSFHRLYLLEGPESHWIGLRNFVTFVREPLFLHYWRATAFWTIGSLAGRLAFGMLLALLLNRPVPFRPVLRALALIPWVMPMVVAAIIWQWIFNGEWGILNHVLKSLGIINRNISWLGLGTSSDLIWLPCIVVSVWKGYPLPYALILAGLQGIPKDLYEAATIDGADSWASFWNITLPMLRPILFVVLLLQTLFAMQGFTAIWTLTQGGPANYTTTIPILVYRTSFEFYRMGYGASIAVMLMLVLMVLSVVYIGRVRYTY